METSSVDIHKYLNLIIDLQTHHRLREAQGRKRAEDLNERVLMWSILEALSIIVIAASQTFMLKSFFSEKRPLVGR